MSPQFKAPATPATPDAKKVTAPQSGKVTTSRDRVPFSINPGFHGHLEGNTLTLIVDDVTTFEKPSKSGKSFLIALTGGWKNLTFASGIGKAGANIVANITIGVKADDYQE